MAKQNGLQEILQGFVLQMTGYIETETKQRLQSQFAAFLGLNGTPKRRGRPPQSAIALPAAGRIAKARARQICPVPGCKNTAAAVFGMVCKAHKDVPKSKIKQYRAKLKAEREKSKKN